MNLVVLIGVLLILLSDKVPAGIWRTLVQHLGTAAFIAAVLGLTIDWWLKRQIAEDVFSVAMGYELPNDLREEMRHVYSSRVICKNHRQIVSITKIDDDHVRVEVALERKFENISSIEQPIKVALGIDEWNVPGHPSEIAELGYKLGSETHRLVPGDATINPRPQGPEAIAPKSINIGPDEELTTYSRGVEFKPLNGEVIYWFSYATLNPSVTVNAPGFKHLVEFAHREKAVTSIYGDTTSLNGLLLPNVGIRVRWWPELTAPSSEETASPST